MSSQTSHFYDNYTLRQRHNKTIKKKQNKKTGCGINVFSSQGVSNRNRFPGPLKAVGN